MHDSWSRRLHNSHLSINRLLMSPYYCLVNSPTISTTIHWTISNIHRMPVEFHASRNVICSHSFLIYIHTTFCEHYSVMETMTLTFCQSVFVIRYNYDAEGKENLMEAAYRLDTNTFLLAWKIISDMYDWTGSIWWVLVMMMMTTEITAVL